MDKNEQRGSPSAAVSQIKKNHLNNFLTYHRWFVGMVQIGISQQCRKDILFENQILNKKIIHKTTPFNQRFTKRIKENKWRITYFFGFCLLFSMDKLYNISSFLSSVLVLQNRYTKNFQKSFQNLVIKKSNNILKEQEQIKKILQKSKLGEQKMQQLGTLFLSLDRKFILTVELMKKLNTNKNGQGYQHDYVDLGSFVEYFQQQSVQNIKRIILGEYPHLNLAL